MRHRLPNPVGTDRAAASPGHGTPQAESHLPQAGPGEQAAFINEYETLMNGIEADEAVVFVDAVHPTHAVRPVGCWAPKDLPIAVEQSSGRNRLNIHGAIDLETGQTVMKDVLTVDAISTIMLLMAIEARYPGMRFVHVLLDNARYHHAKLVQAWLARPGCRISCISSGLLPALQFDRTAMGADAPAYHPQQMLRHLQGVQHRNADLPARGSAQDGYCDEVTDNFRVITQRSSGLSREQSIQHLQAVLSVQRRRLGRDPSSHSLCAEFTGAGQPSPGGSQRQCGEFLASPIGGYDGHDVDTDQRRIPLTINGATADQSTFDLIAPSDPGITVPGYYMLFALNANNTPSMAKIIQVENSCDGLGRCIDDAG